MFGIERSELQLQSSCQLFVFAQLLNPRGVAPASNNEHSRDIGSELLQEFQSFFGECFIRACYAGNVAARPCQALNKTLPDGVGNVHEHDWSSGSCPEKLGQSLS